MTNAKKASLESFPHSAYYFGRGGGGSGFIYSLPLWCLNLVFVILIYLFNFCHFNVCIKYLPFWCLLLEQVNKKWMKRQITLYISIINFWSDVIIGSINPNRLLQKLQRHLWHFKYRQTQILPPYFDLWYCPAYNPCTNGLTADHHRRWISIGQQESDQPTLYPFDRAVWGRGSVSLVRLGPSRCNKYFNKRRSKCRTIRQSAR